MAKQSTTLGKFNLDKIKKFTSDEIRKLSAGKIPICYQIGSHILVGNRQIEKVSDSCWAVTNAGTLVGEFSTRKTAIIYCIALHQKKLALAKEIELNDRLLSKLENDAILYRYRYKQASKAADSWLESHYSNRYTDAARRIVSTKQRVQNLLSRTKYNKG